MKSIRPLLVILILFVSACSPVDEKNSNDVVTDGELVWPLPPDAPKIRFLYAFRKPSDLGFRPPLIKRFFDLLAGKDNRSHMRRPYGIAVDEGLIAVADPGFKSIHLFNTEKRRYKEITSAAGEEFASPVGIGLAPERIYIADSTLGKVFVLDRKGKHIRTITGLKRPTGIAYHRANDRLYVADTLGQCIAVFSGEGELLHTFGKRGGAPGEFNYPSHLTLVGDTLYVNDTMNFRLQAFNLDGTPTSVFGELGDGSGQFAQSKGVASDSEGHLYVADALSNYVQIFDKEGRFLLAFGGMGHRAGQFQLPAGLFVQQDRIYVVDSQNRRIQVFEYLREQS